MSFRRVRNAASVVFVMALLLGLMATPAAAHTGSISKSTDCNSYEVNVALSSFFGSRHVVVVQADEASGGSGTIVYHQSHSSNDSFTAVTGDLPADPQWFKLYIRRTSMGDVGDLVGPRLGLVESIKVDEQPSCEDTVTIEKAWEGDDVGDVDVTFDIKIDGDKQTVDEGEEITLPAGSTLTYEGENLGEGFPSDVCEVTSEANKTEIENDGTSEDDHTITVTNDVTCETGEVTVEKDWVLGEGTDGRDDLDELDVTFTVDVNGTTHTDIEDGHTFEDLSLIANDGKGTLVHLAGEEVTGLPEDCSYTHDGGENFAGVAWTATADNPVGTITLTNTVTCDEPEEPGSDNPSVGLYKFWFDADGDQLVFGNENVPEDGWEVTFGNALTVNDGDADWGSVSSGTYTVSEQMSADIAEDWDEVTDCAGLDVPDLNNEILGFGTGDHTVSSGDVGAIVVCNQATFDVAGVQETRDDEPRTEEDEGETRVLAATPADIDDTGTGGLLPASTSNTIGFLALLLAGLGLTFGGVRLHRSRS